MRGPLVGLGNELRGDDAAGLLVAREVRALTRGRVAVEEVSGDLEPLVRALLAGGEVIVVDAVRSPGPEGEVLALDPERLGPAAAPSSHGLGLAEAVAIARALGGRACLRVWGIRGCDFSLGAPVSPRVAEACSGLAAVLARTLEVSSCA